MKSLYLTLKEDGGNQVINFSLVEEYPGKLLVQLFSYFLGLELQSVEKLGLNEKVSKDFVGIKSGKRERQLRSMLVKEEKALVMSLYGNLLNQSSLQSR